MNLSTPSGCNEPKDDALLNNFECFLQPGVAVSTSPVVRTATNTAEINRDIQDTWSNRQPDHIYDFQTQLEKGKKAEAYFEDLANHWITQNRICGFRDVRKDPKYRKHDIDYICTLPDGKEIKFEIKGDSTDTGNMFVELYVPGYTLDATGNIVERHTEHGWLYQSKADYVFYCFTHPKMHKAYLMQMDKLAAWVDAMSLRCNFSYLSQKRSFQLRGAKNLKENDPYGSYYYGIGVLVPLKDVETANRDASSKERFLTIYSMKTSKTKSKGEHQ